MYDYASRIWSWTGNLIVGEGTIPFLIEGGAGAYLETMAKFTHVLEVETIVPGHLALTSGAILGRYLAYLSELIESMRKAIRAGRAHAVRTRRARRQGSVNRRISV
jgi:hypothetical protein